MIPPKKKYIESICVNCGWSSISYEPSDYFKSVPTTCKKCGSHDFYRKRVGNIYSLLKRFLNP